MDTSVHSIPVTVRKKPSASYREYLSESRRAELALSRRLYVLFTGSENNKTLERFDSCRTSAWFVRNTETGLLRVRSFSCGLRWCPFCARAKAYKYSQAALPWIEKTRHPKFLTLTLRHSTEPLSCQIDKIYNDFKRLRKSSLFTKNVTGGLWFFQVVKSKKTQEFHPHIHCVLDGRYIPHSELKALWQRITGDSTIVDIRKVSSAKAASDYVSRYVSRPISLAGLNDDELYQLNISFFKRRLCGTFGSARSVLFDEVKSSQVGEWRSVGSWASVVSLAGTDENAALILESWLEKKPLSPEIDILDVEDFLDLRPHAPPCKKVVTDPLLF